MNKTVGWLVIVAAMGWGMAGAAVVAIGGERSDLEAQVRSLEADALGRQTEVLNLRAAVAEMAAKGCPAR